VVLIKEFVGATSGKFPGRPHRLLRAVAFLISLAALPAAHAALTIEIVGTGATQLPIAVVPFRAEAGLAQPVTPVIASDLARSGLFRMVDSGGLNPPPYEPQDLNYSNWRARGADAAGGGAPNTAILGPPR